MAPHIVPVFRIEKHWRDDDVEDDVQYLNRNLIKVTSFTTLVRRAGPTFPGVKSRSSSLRIVRVLTSRKYNHYDRWPPARHCHLNANQVYISHFLMTQDSMSYKRPQHKSRLSQGSRHRRTETGCHCHDDFWIAWQSSTLTLAVVGQ